MTILQTTDTVGGVWTYALDLMRALPGERWILATMGAPLRPDQRVEVEALQRDVDVTLCESDFALEWQLDPWRDVDRAGEWLLELEAAYAPDIVHLNGYAHASLPFQAPTLCVAHSCVLSWWRAVKCEDAPPEWNCYRERVKHGLHAADLVAAPTRAMLGAIEVLYGPLPQPPARRQVLANGRDVDAGAVQKEPFLFAAGRLWDEAKNIAALEEIAARLPWPVKISGDNEIGASTGIGRASSVEFLGRLAAPQVLETMRRASIYALPARYEPFGLSILEAALCSCALVVGDIATLREVWGDAALFVPPGDTRALEQALRELCLDAAKRQELGCRARERAKYFSRAQFGCGYGRAYNMLLKSPRVLSA